MLQNRLHIPSDVSRPTIYPMPNLPAASGTGTPIASRPGKVIRQAIRSIPIMVLGVGIGIGVEMFAPENYKISSLTGGFLGHEKLVATAAQMDALRATAAVEADARVRAQQLVEQYRQAVTRITQGCQTMFQRYEIANRLAADTQRDYLTKRAELLTKALSGKISQANTYDSLANLRAIAPQFPFLGGNLSGEEQRKAAGAARQAVMNEFDAEMRKGMQIGVENLKQWTPGVGLLGTPQMPAECLTQPDLAPTIGTPAPPPQYNRPIKN